MTQQELRKALDLSTVSPSMQLKDYSRQVRDDAAWRYLTEARGNKIKQAAWKQQLLRALKISAGRSEDYVAKYYARWQKTRLAEANPKTEIVTVPVTWRGERLEMSIWGWRYVYLLRLYRLIELIRPKRIIEVGCGSGFFPSILACRFPNIELHGVELTVEGVRSAQDGQKLDQLPQPLVEFSPEPLIDLSGHKRVVFHRASAREMPFENASFDLVYTICSMEQMELIRRSALGEISRITGRYLSNFECFRDVNMIGLQRKYIQAMNYYEGSISELEEFRLRPIYIDDDMPQKFYMNVAHVICEKIR